MKILSSFIAAILVLLSLSSAHAAETVKVAAIFAKTGKTALYNTPALDGIRFAIKELNLQGGVLGKQLELLEFDNQSTALGSKIAAKKAVQSKVIIVFGASWSSHSIAMAPVFQTAKIPMISPLSTNPEVTLVGDYIFRICFIDSFQGKVMAKFALQDMKAKTAGVLINANSKYSEGLAQYFVQNYQNQGGKILFKEHYLDKTADFTPVMEKIKTLQPEIIFLPGRSKDSGLIIKQARNVGISTIFLGGDGWSNDLYKTTGNIIEGNFFSKHWHRGSASTKSQEFVAKYKNHFTRLISENALAYDSISLFADAVRRAGSFDPAKIRNAIAKTQDFQGVTGDITFNKNGDPIKPAVILKFAKGTSLYVKTINP